MAKRPSTIRAQAEQVYALTNELQVQLKVLEEAHALVPVRIKPRRLSILNGDSDIAAIAFIVLMEAAKSAQEDLKAIMAQVKAINREKTQLREMLDEVQDARPSRRAALDFDGVLQLLLTLYEKQIEAEARELLNRLDSMSEMGETESLRLQMVMDRMSKMMTVISNLLAKLSETNSQIVQNLK